jgi:rubrerythrin
MNTLSVDQAHAALLKLLRMAHANEQAAAHAYTGHSRGLFISSTERRHIRSIAQAEVRHHQTLQQLLSQLHVQPSSGRARFMAGVGQWIGLLCVFGGRLIPMYGAGWLESDVVNIYVQAAEYAWLANHQEMIPQLLAMAEEEWDHEDYFRQGVTRHWLGKRLKMWQDPGPRQNLRTDFARFCQKQQKQRIYGNLQQVKPTP